MLLQRSSEQPGVMSPGQRGRIDSASHDASVDVARDVERAGGREKDNSDKVESISVDALTDLNDSVMSDLKITIF